MNHVRRDTKTDTAVNRGLAVAMLVDLSAGVKLMTEAGVPPSVIARVCLAPQQRRATDWKR